MTHYPPTPPMPQHEGPTSGLAVAAMIVGIVALLLSPLLLFGVVALVLGIVAVGQTGEPTGRPGRGFAIAGVVMGASSLALGLIMLLMIGVMMPALGAARNTARRMQNSTQLRGIHQGLVTYANSNRNYFPGIHPNGEVLADGLETGNSGDGNTPQARYWIMFDGDYFTPDYAISPSETEMIVEYSFAGPVTKDHYSYAMLQFSKTGQAASARPGDPPTYPLDPATAGRAEEWKQTLNSQAVVLSDRNIGSDTGPMIQSIHSGAPGSWQGSVLWNDNHVAFETSHLFQTKYANGQMDMSDHLFENANGYDALMVWDRAD